MKLRSKVISLVSAAVFSLSLPAFASASTHTNTTNDTEGFIVYASSGGVLVPFGLSLKMSMNITVSYPGKIVTYEDMYATVPAGAQLPFKASVSVGSLKYYKDGSHVFTHSLPLAPSYIKNPADLADFNANRPNTDLVDSSTYKAVGSASYFSSSSTPAAYTGDLTEGVVD